MAFQAGDPLHKLSARWLNRVDSLVRRAATSKDALAIGELESQWSDNQIIRVKNASGTAVKQFGVLKVAGPLISPADNETEFRNAMVAEGATPSAGDTKLCITLEPLAPGAIGRAVVGGLVPVKLRATTSATTEYASGAATVEWLDYSTGGIPVVWNGPRDEETNVRWAWVFLGPAATALTEGGNTNTTLINGCDVSDCLPEGSPFAVKLRADDKCLEVPKEWELGGVIGARGNCCEGRIWFDYQRWLEESGPGNTYFPIILRHLEKKRWQSDWIRCNDLLKQRDPSAGCGTATWEWMAEPGTISCTYRWIAVAVECVGTHNWVWYETGPGVGAWSYSGNSCESTCGDLMPPVEPSFAGYFDGYSTTLPCIPAIPWRWELEASPDPRCPSGGTCEGTDADPEGAPLGPPETPPTSGSDTQTFNCSVTVAGAPSWVMVSGCRCGTAVAPTSPGTTLGERVTTLCTNDIDADHDGYPDNSTDLLVRWVMDANGDVAWLRLMDAAGKVYMSYSIPSPRSFCCLCANSFVFDGCGPYYRCPPAGAICVRPHTPAQCNIGVNCDSTLAEVEITAPEAIDNWQEGTLNEADRYDSLWPWLSDLSGFFQLQAVTTDTLLELGATNAPIGCCSAFARITRETSITLPEDGYGSAIEPTRIYRRVWDIHYAPRELTESDPPECEPVTPRLYVYGRVEVLYRYKPENVPPPGWTEPEFPAVPLGDADDPATWWMSQMPWNFQMAMEADAQGECGETLQFTPTSLVIEGEVYTDPFGGASATGGVVES